MLFLAQNTVEGRARFAHRVAAKLGEDVRLFDALCLTNLLDLRDDFLGHVLVVVGVGQAVLDGESAPDVQGVKGRANLLKLDVHAHRLIELIPVVGRVVDTRVDKEVKHLQLHVGDVLDVVLVHRNHFFVANPQSRRVEFELGLFFGCDAYAYFDRMRVLWIDLFHEQVELFAVVHNRNHVGPTIVDHPCNVLGVLRPLVAVAHDELVFGDASFFFECFNQVDVKS